MSETKSKIEFSDDQIEKFYEHVMAFFGGVDTEFSADEMAVVLNLLQSMTVSTWQSMKTEIRPVYFAEAVARYYTEGIQAIGINVDALVLSGKVKSNKDSEPSTVEHCQSCLTSERRAKCASNN